MQHRIAFAREQRIHAHTSPGGNLLEAPAFQLVGNKHLALLLRQFVDRQLEFIEKYAADIKCLWSSIWRRQQVFELRRFVVLVRDCGIAETLRPLLAEKISDAIT